MQKAPFTLVLRTPWHSGRQLVPFFHLTLPLLGFSPNKPRGPNAFQPSITSVRKHNSTASPRVLSCSSFLSCPLPPPAVGSCRVPTSSSFCSYQFGNSTPPAIRPTMAATALLLPSLAAPTATQRRTHSSLQPSQLQRGSLACCSRSLRPPRRRPRLAVPAVQETKEGEAKTAEEITEKYGLEFGLWKVSGGHRGRQPPPFRFQPPSEAHVS